jgi:very-short-patch-repair endonuclease
VKQCLSDLGVSYWMRIMCLIKSFQPLTEYADKQLRPDFRFLNHDIIIEYDGEQHFRPKAFGKMSQEKAEENLKETQENDKIKDDFCKENGFKMIRIPYTKFANTLSILSVELHDIIDWYG